MIMIFLTQLKFPVVILWLIEKKKNALETCTKLSAAFTYCMDSVAEITLHYSESPAWSPSRESLEWSVTKIFVSSRKYDVISFSLSHK